MFRIGILGSDNSHALAFSKLCNIKDEKTGKYNFEDVRITAIYGLDRSQTEKVAKEGLIEYIAEKPEDMMGRVDAVMVVFRHGDLHAQYALPFIKAGIPTWIDKPFTVNIDDAKKLVEEAEKHNTLLTGGSTCKYAHNVLALKAAAEDAVNTGIVSGGVVNFPADLKSEYAGLFFYGPHLAEMVMAIFGYDIQSVTSRANNGTINVIARYEKYNVVMNFTRDCPKYYGMVYGSKGIAAKEIDISDVYRLGFERFVEMLRTRKLPFELEYMITPVVLLNAINLSIESGKEVYLEELV